MNILNGNEGGVSEYSKILIVIAVMIASGCIIAVFVKFPVVFIVVFSGVCLFFMGVVIYEIIFGDKDGW